jgi:hypothetical protein
MGLREEFIIFIEEREATPCKDRGFDILYTAIILAISVFNLIFLVGYFFFLDFVENCTPWLKEKPARGELLSHVISLASALWVEYQIYQSEPLASSVLPVGIGLLLIYLVGAIIWKLRELFDDWGWIYYEGLRVYRSMEGFFAFTLVFVLAWLYIEAMRWAWSGWWTGEELLLSPLLWKCLMIIAGWGLVLCVVYGCLACLRCLTPRWSGLKRAFNELDEGDRVIIPKMTISCLLPLTYIVSTLLPNIDVFLLLVFLSMAIPAFMVVFVVLRRYILDRSSQEEIGVDLEMAIEVIDNAGEAKVDKDAKLDEGGGY